MPRMGISYEDVAIAADELWQKEQRSPTLDAVRTVLGGGSYTTISKHLKRWNEQYLNLALKNTYSTKAPKVLNQAVDEIWIKLSEEARQEAKSQQQILEQELDNLKKENQGLKQQNSELKNEIEDIAIKNSHLKADLKLLHEKFIEEKRQKSILEEILNEKEHWFIKTIDEKDKHYAAMEKQCQEELKILKSELQSSKELHVKEIEHYRALLENQRTESMLQIDALRTAKEKLEKLNISKEYELKETQKLIESLTVHKKSIEVDLNVLKTETATMQHEHAKQKEQLQKMEIKEQIDGYYQIDFKGTIDKLFETNTMSYKKFLDDFEKKIIYILRLKDERKSDLQ